MNCKLKCGRPAEKSIAFADMCVECYNEHSRAIAAMHRSDKI